MDQIRRDHRETRQFLRNPRRRTRQERTHRLANATPAQPVGGLQRADGLSPAPSYSGEAPGGQAWDSGPRGGGPGIGSQRVTVPIIFETR
ncbi:protein of unknown function [Nitrospira japonica]|uniref:Uncharacterized protein n=1 Tax=Nitrospira japonica TaxID=1325564 RepID=A0A1W1I8W8_9BACT|nr:protein of unknown function [Nitrospira japonica]